MANFHMGKLVQNQVGRHLQELNTFDPENTAQIPRTIEIELTEDLVNSCSAGDVVTVLGLVKVMSTDPKRGDLETSLSSEKDAAWIERVAGKIVKALIWGKLNSRIICNYCQLCTSMLPLLLE